MAAGTPKVSEHNSEHYSPPTPPRGMLFTPSRLPNPLPVLLLGVPQEGGRSLGPSQHWGTLLPPCPHWAGAAEGCWS